MTLISRRSLCFALAASALAVGAQAQSSYPSKPIKIIVPFGPGGVADITARTVAEQMQATLKQPIVIENRPSAGSIVGSDAVAKAEPDGYTLLLMSNGNAVSTGLFKALPFDVTKDFAPVATLGYFDLAAFVSKESRFKNLKEVVQYAQANPGKLTIGTIAVGSTQHLSAELFKTQAKIDALVVPYKGSPAVLTALRAGEIDVAFEILSPMIPQVQSGVVRALAVTSDKRFSGLPDVPTATEAGIANYNVASWNALAAPAKTPKDVIAKLNKAANDAVKVPAVQKRLQELGVRAEGSTPEGLNKLLASEIKRWGAVITAAKIEAQ